jgi:hypothetical protein
MGFEDEVEQSFGRPRRQCDNRSKRKYDLTSYALQLRALPEHLHDPDFWKALATARKWTDVNAWRFHWHRFIDHLADGGDVESFFGAL